MKYRLCLFIILGFTVLYLLTNKGMSCHNYLVSLLKAGISAHSDLPVLYIM
jgi:hypothetical protein